jgi:hypothetical protein
LIFGDTEEMTKPHGKRQKVTVTVDDWSGYDLEGSILDLRKRIDETIERYGEDLRLDWGQHDQDQWDERYSLAILLVRDETNEEMNARLTQQRRSKEAREKAEREQLAALLEKYGDQK